MKKIKVEIEYDTEDIVYLRTDPERLPRMVVGVLLTPIGVMYLLRMGGEDVTDHYGCEITTDRTVD